nr:MAG: ORF3 [Torque teno polar bear virus 40]
MGRRRLPFADRSGGNSATSGTADAKAAKATAPILEAGATATARARQIFRNQQKNQKLQALIDELYKAGRGRDTWVENLYLKGLIKRKLFRMGF